MSENKEQHITIIDDNGQEQLAEILFTHYSERFDSNYVFLIVEDNEIIPAKYDPSNDGEGMLMDIESEEEWEYVEDLFEKYAEENNLGEE